MALRRLLTVMFIAALAEPSGAAPVANVDVAALTGRSELVVVGRVVSVTRQAAAIEDYSTQFVASIAVDHVVKGKPSGAPISVIFEAPGTLGYPEVVPDVYAVFFLKPNKNRYEFTDRWYPSLPAVETEPNPSGPPLDQVAAILGQVLESNKARETAKAQALEALGRLHTEFAGHILRKALQQEESDFHLEVARTLVARNDITGFPAVEDALLHPAALPERALLNLAGSLAGLKDSRAAPGLTTLADTTNSTIRRFVAIALRQTGSAAAVKPLGKLLYDNDFNTRYNAVAGLGEITHQDSWTPALDEFKKNESRYLTYWQRWLQTEDGRFAGMGCDSHN